MASLLEIFNKLVGVDPNKDYDFSIAERGTGANPPTEPTSSPSPSVPLVNNPNPTTETNTDNVSRETFEKQTEQLNQALNEINNLKQMNFALITKTPVNPNDTMSVDQCIASICNINTGGTS